MSGELSFNFQAQDVRTTEINGEPWLILSDVCKVLGLSQPHRVASRIDPKDQTRTKVTITQVNGETAVKSMTVINESGLYTVVLQSNKPEARRFQHWITHDVLPSIRKTGHYSTQGWQEDVVQLAKEIIRKHEGYLE